MENSNLDHTDTTENIFLNTILLYVEIATMLTGMVGHLTMKKN